MLSYRHAYHAGNHADVLKHLVLMLALERLLLKDKPLCYVDTHAGPGDYVLDVGPATMNAEHASGIRRLENAPSLPAPLRRYLERVRQYAGGSTETIARYPGSPALARAMLGEHSRLELSELHPADFEQLERWAASDRRSRVEKVDGFVRLRALLPPLERRALVLIDPSYEVKSHYDAVVAAVAEARKRFPTVVCLVWYPLLDAPGPARLCRGLAAQGGRQLRVELRIREPTGRGMYGSGMWLANPPWQLKEQLEESADALVALLGDDASAGLRIEAKGLE